MRFPSSQRRYDRYDLRVSLNIMTHGLNLSFELGLSGLFFEGREPSKNRRMPLSAESTRYSLVKGERIVRSVLTARLRTFH